MAFERLLGFLKAGAEVAFGGETPIKEAKRIVQMMVNKRPFYSEVTLMEMAGKWMGSTGFSDQGQTGVDQISLLVFSNNTANMELAAHVLKNHQIYLAACAADIEQQRPTQWITRMVQAESAFVRGTALDLISEFDLDDIDTIRQAMGIEPKPPAFVDSREPD